MTPTERLIARLNDAGFTNVKIYPVSGYYKRQDVYRWEGTADRGEVKVCLFSWNTITECAKGIDVCKDEYAGNYSVYAL